MLAEWIGSNSALAWQTGAVKSSLLAAPFVNLSIRCALGPFDEVRFAVMKYPLVLPALAVTLGATLGVIGIVWCAVSSAAEPQGSSAALLVTQVDALGQIRETAMRSDWAWQRLEELTDHIGPRLSGSPQNAAAVAQVAAAMRSLGADVHLQAVKVPHWVRGEERAELTDYAGRPAGITQMLHLTTLGGSSATAAAGLTAKVIVVHDFNELKARGAEVRGNIVLFDQHFDQRLADNGHAGVGLPTSRHVSIRRPCQRG